MVATEVERVCAVDIALRWGTGYDTVMRSFVNIIATPKGGTHQQGFEQELLKVLRTQVEQNARRLKVGNDKLEKDDVLAGLTAVLTVNVPEPQFEGQTKEVLGTPAVRQIVAQVLRKDLGERFSSTKRDDKSQAAQLLDKVVAEMKARVSARATRRPSAARTRWSRRRCPPSSWTAARPTSRRPSCSSSRATRRSAPRSSRAPASTRRCCRSAARS